MNYKCEEISALLIASTELVETVGQAMIVFAAIEGFVNLVLHSMTTDPSDLKGLPRSISRRLDFFGELACQSPALTSEEVNEIISRAKSSFHQRNFIAHSPLVSGGEHAEAHLRSMSSSKVILFATDVRRITEEADVVFNDIRQLHFNYMMGIFDAND